MIIKKYREGSCSSFFYINTEALGNLGSSRLTRADWSTRRTICRAEFIRWDVIVR